MDKLDIAKKASEIRNRLNISADAPVDLFTIVNAIPNMTVVYLPMGENISGICIKNKETPVIAVNSSMSVGRQHFSLAHELYHFYFDDIKQIGISGKEIGTGNDSEKCADQFASYFLIPINGFIEKARMLLDRNVSISIKEVVELEQYFKVSRQAILIRLLEEKLITTSQKNEFSKNVKLSAINLGYSDTLYKPNPQEKAYGTFGYYIKTTDKLYAEEMISTGQFEEFLLSAFREDLVYGEEQEDLND